MAKRRKKSKAKAKKGKVAKAKAAAKAKLMRVKLRAKSQLELVVPKGHKPVVRQVAPGRMHVAVKPVAENRFGTGPQQA